MKQLDHCLCSPEQLRQNKSSCIPMGIKNAQKNTGCTKKQTSENDLLLEFQYKECNIYI